METTRCENEECGKDFLVRTSQKNNGKGKYCSRECYAQVLKTRTHFNLKKWHEQNPQLSKIAREKQRTAVTGKVAHNRGKPGKANFGSFRIGQYAGERNPQWKGGRWLHAKRKVLERDKGICRRCGFSDLRIMHVDHIVPIRAARDERRIMERDGRLRIEGIDGLQILCPNCHAIKTLEDVKRGWQPKNSEEASFLKEIKTIEHFISSEGSIINKPNRIIILR